MTSWHDLICHKAGQKKNKEFLRYFSLDLITNSLSHESVNRQMDMTQNITSIAEMRGNEQTFSQQTAVSITAMIPSQEC